MEGIIRALDGYLFNGNDGIIGIDGNVGIDLKLMIGYGKLFEVIKLTRIFDLLNVITAHKSRTLKLFKTCRESYLFYAVTIAEGCRLYHLDTLWNNEAFDLGASVKGVRADSCNASVGRYDGCYRTENKSLAFDMYKAVVYRLEYFIFGMNVDLCQL